MPTLKRISASLMAGPSRVALATSLIWIPLVGVSALAQTTEQESEQVAKIAAPVVPQQVRYAGKLATRSGDTVEAVFSIYAAAEGGEPLWTETQKVAVDQDGSYTVLLGSVSHAGLPQTLFAGGAARWLGVSVEREPEQSRVLLSSVPYAMKSADTQALAGHPAGDFVTQEQLSQFAQSEAQRIAAPEFNPLTSGTITGSGTTGTIPQFTGANTIGNSEIVQVGTEIGVNESAPAATLDVGGTEQIRGTLTLPSLGTATTSSGERSQELQWTSSAWSTTTAGPISPIYKMYVSPVSNNTSAPAGTLLFTYQVGTGTPSTALSINSNGSFVTYGGMSAKTSTVATSSVGASSPFLGLGASTYKSSTSSAIAQNWGWQAVPTGNNTTTPSSNVSLLYGAGNATPAPTGFSIAANGIVNFAPGQTFPGGGGTITGITTTSPLAGSGTSGSVALSLNTSALETTLNGTYPQLGTANAFTGNQSITGNLTATGTLTATSSTVSGESTATGGILTEGELRMQPATSATAAAGVNSPPLEIDASAYSSTSSSSLYQKFAWETQAANNDTSTPTGNLALLFGAGSGTLESTGLSIAQTGKITFASGQTFPGTGAGTITGITTTSPLSGSGTSGSVALSLNTSALETTLNSVYPKLGATTNSFTGNGVFAGYLEGSASGGGSVAVFGNGTNGATALYGLTDSGVSVDGVSASGYGGYFANSSTTNPALYAIDSANSTGAGDYPTAISGVATGTVSTGVYGSGTDTGVWGDVTESNAPAGAYAIYGGANNGNGAVFFNSSVTYPTIYSQNDAEGSSGNNPTVLAAAAGGDYAFGVVAATTGLNTRGVNSDVTGNGSIGIYGESDGAVDSGTGNAPAGVKGIVTGNDGNGLVGDATGTGGYGLFAHVGGASDSVRVSTGVYGLADLGLGVLGIGAGHSGVYNGYLPLAPVAGVWGDTSLDPLPGATGALSARRITTTPVTSRTTVPEPQRFTSKTIPRTVGRFCLRHKGMWEAEVSASSTEAAIWPAPGR